MLHLDELANIENLLDLGKYEDVKTQISDLKLKIKHKNSEVDLELLFARYLRETGNAKESEQLTNNLIIKAKELQNSLLLTKTFVSINLPLNDLHIYNLWGKQERYCPFSSIFHKKALLHLD